METVNRPLNPYASPFQSATKRKSDLFSNFQKLISGDQNALNTVTDQLIYFFEKTAYLDGLFNQRLLTDFRKRFNMLEREIQFLNQENTDLRQRLAETEDATKSLLLRLDGLPENDQMNLFTYVANTLSRTGVICTEEDIDFVRRLGKHKPGAPRTVLIKFIKQSKRDAILFSRANLNKESNGPNDTNLIWLNDDVSDITRRNRKLVRDVANQALDIGVENVKIHGDGIVIGNGKFKHRDLDLLPPPFSLPQMPKPFTRILMYFSRVNIHNSQIFIPPALRIRIHKYTNAWNKRFNSGKRSSITINN